MNPSEQARQVRGKFETLDAAVRAAVADGTIITLMGNRGKDMMVNATSNMLISAC